ncbi:MAG TPA: hypothetical protein VNN77_07030 [candidate division Zixibacteria bacterium]|nr:hypothetical protein [candidate division Zixibacteria bacterium]
MSQDKTSGKRTRSRPRAAVAKASREIQTRTLARPSPVVDPENRHQQHRSDPPQPWNERKRLFLRVGDEVTHLRYEEWGIGVVMEIMTSSVPGGTCLARVRFQDGQLRCFNNDLDNESCCYYFGVRRYWNPFEDGAGRRVKPFAIKG